MPPLHSCIRNDTTTIRSKSEMWHFLRLMQLWTHVQASIVPYGLKYPLPDMRHYVSYPSFIHSSRWSRSNKTCWRQYVKTIRKYLISFIYKKVGRALPCRFPQKEVLYIFSLKRWITFNSIFICYLILILSKCKDLSKLSTNALWCLDHLAKKIWKGILLFRSIK